MRAALNILAAVVVAGCTMPASAAFWQQHKAPRRTTSGRTCTESNSLMAQSHGGESERVPKTHLMAQGRITATGCASTESCRRHNNSRSCRATQCSAA